MELIKEFIETCPYLKNGKVNVDYIKDKPQSYSIDETPVDPVLQILQMVEEEYRYNLIFLSKLILVS